MDKIIVPFDSGNAEIIPSKENMNKIIITSNGVKYEFDVSPAGIDSFSVDGGKVKKYEKKEV